jgi:hypothetical protein
MCCFFSGLSLFAQSSTNTLPALSPAYPELPPTFWEQHESAIIVGGFAFLAVAFLFLRVWLRPESKIILPPEILARDALTQLLRQPEDGKLLSEVSQILRRYVAAAFELPSGEMTTVEFSAAIAGNEKIGAELAQTISSFLRECDERKFSPVNSSAPLNAATRALELISLAEKARDRRDAWPTTK